MCPSGAQRLNMYARQSIHLLPLCTVNVEIFAQYIFSRLSRKYDVSANLNHYRLDGIRYKIRENVSTRKGHIGLDARKFSCAKISTFTVPILCMEKMCAPLISNNT